MNAIPGYIWRHIPGTHVTLTLGFCSSWKGMASIYPCFLNCISELTLKDMGNIYHSFKLKQNSTQHKAFAEFLGSMEEMFVSQLLNKKYDGFRAPSQYPKRRLFVRSRKVSKPRDWYFKLSYRFEIWQAHRQHCCRSACQISERSDNSKYKSRDFETLRDLTEIRLFGYWDGALIFSVS